MSDWQTDSSEVVYKTAWFSILRDQVRNHNNKQLTYSYLKMAHPSVFIVAANSKGEVLLQRSFRYTLNKVAWELPAGHSDGQDLLTAAKRELIEETGLASDDWEDLGRIFSGIGVANMPGQYFLARNVRSVTEERDPDEQIIEHTFLEVTKIEAMIRNGEIEAYSVPVGLYLAKIHGL